MTKGFERRAREELGVGEKPAHNIVFETPPAADTERRCGQDAVEDTGALGEVAGKH